MQGKVFIITTCLFSSSFAFFFSDVEWNGLCVTFGINIFDSYVLDDLPRTEQEAAYYGWTNFADCDTDAKFQGARYVKDSDYAVILLFDVNGYIAGIQTGISKTSLPSDPVYPPFSQRGNIFQDDGDRFTLTAYFTDPAKICTQGRTPSQYEAEGTGTALYIQNGSDPVTQSFQAPKSQEDVANTRWVEGYCFVVMGDHYWYNVSEDMSCDNFLPVFFLYNGGKLNAFGWAMGINQTSRRFEHPSHSAISAFMNPVPRCLYNYPVLSTMHIYLTAYPSLNLC